jgi:hypothetical protein
MAEIKRNGGIMARNKYRENKRQLISNEISTRKAENLKMTLKSMKTMKKKKWQS